MKRFGVVLLAGLLAVSVAACGSSSKTQAATDSTASTSVAVPNLRDAVYAYTEAFLGGEAETAYGLLSERCQNKTAQTAFTSIVDQATARYGGATITSYEETINGNVATATYKLTNPALNQTEERWVDESGAWHDDEC